MGGMTDARTTTSPCPGSCPRSPFACHSERSEEPPHFAVAVALPLPFLVVIPEGDLPLEQDAASNPQIIFPHFLPKNRMSSPQTT
jgi:hypothetical protein